MKEVSKILIAYDGSACSDAALNDLRRAGLPWPFEAVVVTVADIILPPPDDELPADDMPAIRIPEVERHAQAHAEKAIKEARTFAERAAKRVKADFPGWDVRAEVRCDSPAWAVIKMADRDNPDLIVVGSHGHSLVGGRLILGSVSQRVLYEARCSVRVARCSDERREGPVRIVVGFNGSPDSEAGRGRGRCARVAGGERGARNHRARHTEAGHARCCGGEIARCGSDDIGGQQGRRPGARPHQGGGRVGCRFHLRRHEGRTRLSTPPARQRFLGGGCARAVLR